MGKSAAERWSVGAYPSLHEAVVGTVKCARLSPEQVRRVVEFANTTAYLTEFRKEGMGHKYIDFGEGGPANPSTVLQDLNDGGGGTVFDTGKTASLNVSAYATAPKPYDPLEEEEKVAVTLLELGLLNTVAGVAGGVAGAHKAGPSRSVEGFARGATGAFVGGGVGALRLGPAVGTLAANAIGAVTGYQLATIGLGKKEEKKASVVGDPYAEAYDPLEEEEKTAWLHPLVGGVAGGVAGAMKADKGERVEAALMGAGGSTLGGMGGMIGGGLAGGVGGAFLGHALGGAPGAAVGAHAGALLGGTTGSIYGGVKGYKHFTKDYGKKGREESEKKASFVGDPYAEAYELRDTLEGQAGHVKEALRQASRNHAHFSADLYEEVKRAALSGYSLGDVTHALSSAAIDDVFVKAAMAGMIDPLLEQGVFLSPEKLAASFTKVAGGTPDLTHPMVQAFQGWCASLEKSASLRKEAQGLEEGVATLNSFIRKRGLYGAAKRVFAASADLGGHIGAGAGHLLAGAGGRETGRSVGRALGYAAPVVATHEAYRRTLKGSPAFQQAKGTALSLVPGTQEYYMAEQNGDPYAMMGGY